MHPIQFSSSTINTFSSIVWLLLKLTQPLVNVVEANIAIGKLCYHWLMVYTNECRQTPPRGIHLHIHTCTPQCLVLLCVCVCNKWSPKTLGHSLIKWACLLSAYTQGSDGATYTQGPPNYCCLQKQRIKVTECAMLGGGGGGGGEGARPVYIGVLWLCHAYTHTHTCAHTHCECVHMCITLHYTQCLSQQVLSLHSR